MSDIYNSTDVLIDFLIILEKSSSTPTAKTIEPEVVESCTETIDKAISSLGHDKLVEILREVQNFIRDHHDEARELLVSNPQLAYALVQIQVALNLITPTQAKVRNNFF